MRGRVRRRDRQAGRPERPRHARGGDHRRRGREATAATDAHRGVAPGAHIISLKVLDADGGGYAGDVVEAIDWAIANRERYRIRVINLSLGGPVLQSARGRSR